MTQLERTGLLQLLVERGLALPDPTGQISVGTTRKVRTPSPGIALPSRSS